MTARVDVPALIADNRKWVRLHRENKYQKEAARRMSLVLDALEVELKRADAAIRAGEEMNASADILDERIYSLTQERDALAAVVEAERKRADGYKADATTHFNDARRLQAALNEERASSLVVLKAAEKRAEEAERAAEDHVLDAEATYERMDLRVRKAEHARDQLAARVERLEATLADAADSEAAAVHRADRLQSRLAEVEQERDALAGAQRADRLRGGATMTITLEILEPAEIEDRVRDLLQSVSMHLDELRERSSRYALTAHEQGVLDQIEDLEYLQAAARRPLATAPTDALREVKAGAIREYVEAARENPHTQYWPASGVLADAEQWADEIEKGKSE